MTPLQFKVTNKAEYDDLMNRLEQEGRTWADKSKLTQWQPPNEYPLYIEIDGNEVYWGRMNWISTEPPTWQIGQPLPPIPKTTIQELCDVPENPDGSITISPELQAKLVVALRGGNHE